MTFGLFFCLFSLPAFAGPPGAAGDVYVATAFDGVLQYDGATGALVGPFVPAASSSGLTFGPNGNLFVSDWGAKSVVEYDGATGALIGTFASGGGLNMPRDLTFGPNGNLFVSSAHFTTNSVFEFDGVTGALIGTFAIGWELVQPHGLVFGPNGNLFVSSWQTSEVIEYDGTTGTLIGTFAEGTDLHSPEGLVFGPNGNLFVCSSFGPGVLEYDGVTGELVGTFADEGLYQAKGVVFSAEGGLFITNGGDEASGAVNEYYSNSGGSVRPFAGLRYPSALTVKPFDGAAVPPPTLTGFAPTQASNCEPLVDALISGSNLEWGAQLRLTRSGEEDILGVITDAAQGTEFTMSFDVTNVAPGSWDLRLDYPDGQLDTLAGAVDLSACMPPVVTGFDQLSADNCGPLGGATITGSGFVSGAAVVLSRPGQTDVVATDVTVESSTTISAGFNLDNVELGLWAAAVVNPDNQSAVLADALDVSACESRSVLFDTSVVLAGGNPRGVAFGDLNGDGNPDMIVANERTITIPNSAQTISVFLGRGDGTFTQQALYVAGVVRPWSVAVGDLDGDGDLDVAVAGPSSTGPALGGVGILLNDGKGTLAPAVTYEFVLGNGSDVAIGDLDGDGDLDLAVTLGGSINTPYIAVLLNNGDATFAAPVLHAANCYPIGLTLGDFDSDGDLDVAVANEASVLGCPGDGVSVLLNDGSANFAAPVLYQDLLTGGPSDVAAGDLDGDGVLDLAVTIAYADAVTVMLGDGDGTFTSHVEHAVGGGPQSVAIGDLNGDGNEDLAVVNLFTIPNSGDLGSYSVLFNNGDATFAPQVVHNVGRNPWEVALADLDHDGDADLVVTTGSRSAIFGRPVAVQLNLGDGTFQDSPHYSNSGSVFAMAAGDLDGDGDIDVAALNTDDTVSVLLNTGAGTLVDSGAYAVGDANVFITNGDPIAIGDFDGDLDEDLVVANVNDSTVSLLSNNGDGTFAAQVPYAVPDPPRAFATGDLDGDGDLDIATAGYGSPSNSRAISILFNNGDGTFASAISYGDGFTARSVAIGDLDGDGDLDVAVTTLIELSGGQGDVLVFINNGDGIFADAVTYDGGDLPVRLVLGDLDQDGDVDMAWRSSVKFEPCVFPSAGNCWTSEISVRLNLGDGTIGERIAYPLETLRRTSGTIFDLRMGDVDGDGDLDLVAAESNDPKFVAVLLNRGDGTFNPRELYGTTLAGGDPLLLADMNADGKLDILAVSGGSVGVLLNRGSALLPGPCPADFDGDGQVRVPDLIFLLGTWGTCVGDCPADFDGSGDVRVPDLIFLLGEWGDCPS